MDLSVGQIQFSLRQGGCGAAQQGVGLLIAAFLLAGALDFGAGGGDLADGLFAVGAGHFQQAHGNGSGVLAIQAFQPLVVLRGLEFVGLRRAQVGLRRGDAGGAGADLTTGGFKVRPGPVDCDLIGLRVDLENHVAGLDVLVVAHVDADHPAGDFRRHRNHKGADPCLLGIGRESVSQQIPGQAHDDQQYYPFHAFFRRVGGRFRWRRGGGGFTHG